MRHTSGVAALFLALALHTATAANDWTQFRGPNAGVADDDPALPDRWSQTENVLWKVKVPGIGWSSPVVFGDHVFVSAVISASADDNPRGGFFYGGHEGILSKAQHRWMVYDVDFATGRIRWERELKNSLPPGPRHVKNSYASETAVTDGERVYFYFGNVGLFAFTMNGDQLWSKPIGPFADRGALGTAASPVLYKDRLYLVSDNDTQSFIAAFDKRTGNEIWRVPRDEGSNNFATPFIWEHGQRTEIITSGTRRVRSYSLDGTPLWELKGMSTFAIPTPFSRHGLLYIASGFPGGELRPVYAIRPGASGDISLAPGTRANEFIAWSYPQLGTYTTTAVVYGDYYYTLDDRGFLLCHDARTGEQIYGRQRFAPDAGGFTSSPWAYNDKVFALSEEGDTYVVQAGREFKILGKNSLDEMAMATPAISRGSLIIRTASSLYRITKKAGA